MTHRYLISDSEHNPIAQAVLESAPGVEPLHLRILDGQAELVVQTEDICLIGMYDEDLTLRGRAGYRYGDSVVVAPYARLDASERRNLRVPIEFHSYFYPITGEWHGQRGFTAKDLSCGGIAFRTDQPLEVGEIIQVVLSPMKYPILVCAKILRPLSSREGEAPTYASKFIDLCDDEDAAIRKAVFSIQLRNR